MIQSAGLDSGPLLPPDAHISVSVAADNEATITITRDEHEQIIAEPLDRVAAPTRKAMETSGTTTVTHHDRQRRREPSAS